MSPHVCTTAGAGLSTAGVTTGVVCVHHACTCACTCPICVHHGWVLPS